jgi:hypothetical protein
MAGGDRCVLAGPHPRYCIFAPLMSGLVALTVGLRLVPRHGPGVAPDLPHRAEIISNEPFFDDLVLAAQAVCNRHDTRFAPGCGAEHLIVA